MFNREVFNDLCKKVNNFRFQFLFSYLLVLLLPVLVGSLIYYRAYELVEKKELETRSLLLQDCMNEMDRTIRGIDQTLLELYQNTNLTKLLHMQTQPTYGSQDAALVYAVNQELSSYMNYNRVDEEIILYLNKPDLVFNGSTIVYGRERFYEQSVSFQEYTYEEFEHQVLDNNHYRDVLGDTVMVRRGTHTKSSTYITKQQGMLYLNTLPPGSGAQNLGTAVVHFGSKITNIFNTVPISEYGCTFILDEEEKIIGGVFGEHSNYKEEYISGAIAFTQQSGVMRQKVDRQQMLISYVKSEYNDWIYVSMSPINRIMEDLRSFQLLIFLTVFFILAAGTVLVVFLSRRNSKPLEAALMELKKVYGENEGASLSEFSNEIHKVINDHKELTTTLEKQKSVMQVSFFDRLLHAEFQDVEEIMAMESYLGLDLSACKYGAVIFSFRETEGAISEKTLLKHDILQMFTEKISLRRASFKAFTHTMSEGLLCMIACFGECERDPAMLLQDELNQMIASAQNDFGRKVVCYAGNLYTKLSDISLSFGEAYSAYDLMKDANIGEPVVFYEKAGQNNSVYFYPNELAIKLKNLTESGNLEGVSELLEYVYKKNLENKQLSRRTLFYLLIDMEMTIVRIVHELKLHLNLNNLFQFKPDNLDCDKEFKRISEAYRKIAAAISRECGQGGSLIRQITAFMENNFSDSRMSISYISSEFHISESYFSQYFKKNTGQVFSKCLETMRINKACELIRESSQTIDEIAEAVGYTNALSFRRAFKKVIGMPPSSYR